ncbi:hypothetical protein NDU88_001113 [Pleurodeles waltl]|uniref:Uncharacterized protein n=1 Tax=Pleurodeles waltl TaxID=8319 RepID=A0AAV7R6X1_PLEWA|nr:hypothetical protein NDU88_001113 [Pleurodeles waltl]
MLPVRASSLATRVAPLTTNNTEIPRRASASSADSPTRVVVVCRLPLEDAAVQGPACRSALDVSFVSISARASSTICYIGSRGEPLPRYTFRDSYSGRMQAQ